MDFAAPTAAVRRTAVGATSKMGGFSSRDLRTTASPRQGPLQSRRSRRRHRRRSWTICPWFPASSAVCLPFPARCRRCASGGSSEDRQSCRAATTRAPAIQLRGCRRRRGRASQPGSRDPSWSQTPRRRSRASSPSCRARLRDRCPRRGPGSCPSAAATSPSGTRRHSPGLTTGSRGQRRCQTSPRRRRTFRGRDSRGRVRA
mmetsp:Transcript_3404/g.13879  ORF Transcript_3404/g.13879 Transcript_3404/m.13879 type:complete len:202 (-) Transcript_3404:943-1548(-)